MTPGWIAQRSQEEDRVQPAPGDMSGAIRPGVIDPAQTLPTRSACAALRSTLGSMAKLTPASARIK